MKKGRKMISGILAVVTVATTILQPGIALASEPEDKKLPTLEEVRDQLEEDEVVEASDYHIEVGSEFDVNSDFTGLSIQDEKVIVTFHEAKNESGDAFNTKKADAFQTVYYVEPKSGNPSYQIDRKIIVEEPSNQKEEVSISAVTVGEDDVTGEKEEVIAVEDTDQSQEQVLENTKTFDEMTDDEICTAAMDLIQKHMEAGEEELKFSDEEQELYNLYQNLITYGNREGLRRSRAAASSLVVKNAKNESGMWDIPLLDYIYSSKTGNQVHNYVKYIANDSANGWRLAYCTQVSKHFIDSTTYISQTWEQNGMYSEISYAIAHGCSKYGDTSDGSYSTGNWIKDYYVTQTVIYCILEDYGYDGHSISSLSAVSGYQDVFNCVHAMYNDVKANAGKEGYGDNPSYKIVAPSSTKMTLTSDETYYRSGWYTISSSGDVQSRTIKLSGAADGCEIVYDNVNSLTSRFYIQMPVEKAYQMKEDTMSFKVVAEAKFKRPYTYIYQSMVADAQNITFQEYQTPSETKGSEASVSVTLDKCKVAVNKVDQETGNGVKGAVYGVYRDSSCTDLIGTMPATDENGHAELEFVKRQKEVFVKEMTASVGYLINTTAERVKVTAKQTSSITVKETPAKGEITVKKKDKETDSFTPQGDATMVGAVYGLYAKTDIVHPDGHTGVVYPAGTLVEQKKYTESGEITFSNLYFGNYYVKEIENPEGYLKDETQYPVTVTYKDQNTAVVKVEATVYETVKKQPFEIIKISSDGSSTETKLVEGAEFTVKLESEVQAKGWDQAATYDTLITDAKGDAISIDLPYGSYHVKETKTPENMNTTKDFYVTISEDSRTPQIWRVFNDAPFTAYIRLIKKDIDTGREVLLSGTTFKIRDLSTGEDVSMKVGSEHVSTFVTDESGMVTTPLKMLPGEYEVYEITAPFGYVVRTESIPFTVTAKGEYHTDDDGDFVVDVEIENKQQRGALHLYKHGEQLVGVKSEGVVASIVAYVKELLEEGSGNMTNYVYEDAPVEGAKFHLIVDEAIYTADHQSDDSGNRIVEEYEGISLQAGAIAAILTTDENGKAELSNLPLGKYHIEEVVAGDGFVLNKEVDTFELSYEGQDVEVVTHNSDFENQRVKAKVSLVKTCAETKRPVAGAVYGLYAKDDIVNHLGEVVTKKDTLLEQQTTNEEGELEFTTDLPLAKYYVKELTAAEGYLLDESVYDLDLTYQGQEVELVAEKLEVTDQPITVEIKKTDITTGEELLGAHLQVIDENGTVYEEWDSTKEQHIIYGIPAGDYTLVEMLTPDGYVTATEVEFTVEETGEVQQVEMKDDYTKVEISKQDIGGKELPGAKLTIFDSDGKEVESWTSTEEVHYIEKLPVGKYVLHEEAAPNGYEIANDVEFEVKDTGEIQHVVMVDEKTPVPTETPKAETPLTPSTGSTTNPVKTGDQTPIMMLFILLGLSGVGIAGMWIYRKKRK